MRPTALLLAVLLCGCPTPDDTSDTEDTDTGTADTADTGDTADTDADCWVESAVGRCYDCPLPTVPGADSLRFLDQCTTAVGAPFDNAARIPSTTWVPGTPLPDVP